MKAQEPEREFEQQIESIAVAAEATIEDDSYQSEIEQMRNHRLNLNEADAPALARLGLLTDLQIENLIRYRGMLGPLISIYELQAIPCWDVSVIRRLVPFVKVEKTVPVKDELRDRLRKGSHSLVQRTGGPVSDLFNANDSGYNGNNLKLFFRYRYSYKNLLQFGAAGEKDAGEKLFRPEYGFGLDFNSVHLFVRKVGIFEAIAIGDYTVNFGQGLVQWQGLAFKKNSDAMLVKRQSPVFKPYSSAGEFNFYRGLAITVVRGKCELSGFASVRKLSASIVEDSFSNTRTVSSLQASGYHRTDTEIQARNRVKHAVFGLAVKARPRAVQLGLHGIVHHFSIPLKKRDEPYNLYAIKGSWWANIGIEYAWTWRNVHLFGESAADMNSHPATIAGILMSPDARIDLSILYRNISPAYQAINANAFTESTTVTNENGLFLGTTLKPFAGWRIDLYSDIYQFPWLKFRSNAPGGGRDFMCQVSYTPSRQADISSRFRVEEKQGNDGSIQRPLYAPVMFVKYNWRTHVNLIVSRSTQIRYRCEFSTFYQKSSTAQSGYLFFFDVLHRPPLKGWSFVFRLQYFETDSYDARIYAFENDVLYSYSIPAFDGKGYRYYFTLNYSFNKKLTAWFRWAHTVRASQNEDGNSAPEAKLQVRYAL